MEEREHDYLHTYLGLHSRHQHDSYDGIPTHGLATTDDSQVVAFVAADQDDENGLLSHLFDAATVERISDRSREVIGGCMTYIVSFVGERDATRIWDGDLIWREAFDPTYRRIAITVPMSGERIVTELDGRLDSRWLPTGDLTLRR